jgi:hypothetical protein
MDNSLPKPVGGSARPCKTVCKQNCDTKVYQGRECSKMDSETESEYSSDSDSEFYK